MDWLAPIRWFQNLRLGGPWPIYSGSYANVKRPPGATRITEDSALTLPSVFAAVNRISSDIAGLPWGHFERSIGTDGKASRRRMLQSDIAWLLHTQPNPETNAFIWRQSIVAHILLWGNGYAQIERDRRSRPVWLWLLEPNVVTPKMDEGGTLIYRVWTDDGWVTLPADDVLHFKGLGFDGRIGYSRVAMAARTFGIALQQDELADSFYGNGAAMGGVIKQTSGKALSPEARDELLRTFNEKYRGSRMAGSWGYVDAGMEPVPFKMPMTDAQFLESRRFTIHEVAQWFQIPPHKLAALDRATWGNIEQQAIDYVVDCLTPLVNMMEAEANSKLFGRNQFGNQYTKLDLRALMRGDQAQRSSAYATALQNGWMTRNEVRGLEDLDPMGPDGDVYTVQSNLTTIELIRNPPEPPAPQLPAPREEEEEDEEESVVEAAAEVIRGFPRLMVDFAAAARPGAPTIVVETHQPQIAFNQAPLTVSVPAPEVRITNGDTFVSVPERDVRIENRVEAAQVNVTVPERSVTVEAGDTTVNVPETVVNVAPAAVTVEAPPPANVTVEPALVTIHAPPPAFDLSPIAKVLRGAFEQQPSITINVPEQPAPVVNVTNNLTLPPRMTDTDIEYDAEGNIIGLTQQDRNA